MSGADRPELALHVCCGPCATAVIERLLPEFRVHAVWFNPNIQPADEHDRRLEAMQTVARAMGVPLTVLERDPSAWERACAGLMAEPEGGARCDVCFRMRLAEVARFAAAAGIGQLATTLTISPHKAPDRINPIGLQAAGECAIGFLARDLKQRNGFVRSVQLSRELAIYRQRYCGCLPSLATGAGDRG